MPPTSQHLAAERDFRTLLADNELPPPDEVEYDEASVVFVWREKKLVVVVDLDEPPNETGGRVAATARVNSGPKPAVTPSALPP
jgi:hypothetical protein